MKNTKQKILKTALALFNKDGLSKVTLRTIAKELNISQGNLNYHYKKRSQIIEALYFELVNNISQSIEKNIQNKNELDMIFKISSAIMIHFYYYRFILLDFSQLMRENERIKNHYKELTLERTNQFNGIIELLISNEILRPQILENEYQNLYIRVQILSDFWMSSALTTHKKITKPMLNQYTEVINQCIYPYLTKKGQEQYHNFLSSN